MRTRTIPTEPRAAASCPITPTPRPLRGFVLRLDVARVHLAPDESYKDAFGLALYFEPTYGPMKKELEAKLIVDKNFLDGELVWAANFVAAQEQEKVSRRMGKGSRDPVPDRIILSLRAEVECGRRIPVFARLLRQHMGLEQSGILGPLPRAHAALRGQALVADRDLASPDALGEGLHAGRDRECHRRPVLQGELRPQRIPVTGGLLFLEAAVCARDRGTGPRAGRYRPGSAAEGSVTNPSFVSPAFRAVDMISASFW